MSAFLPYLRDFALAFIVAIGFAILFSTPRRVLYVAGLLGGIGHCIRFAMLEHQLPIVAGTLVGAIFIGLAGIYAAHKVHVPPIVFTMPACITMIPGLYAYRTMLGCIKLTDLTLAKADPSKLVETVHYFVLTALLLFSLSIGICSGALLFRARSVKSLFRRTF
jgi:uncharacterized membrane protein YjjB (DUF3815 family)